MINKKYLLLLFFLIAMFSFVSSVGEVCCHKLTDGAWCQDAPIEQCDLNFGTSGQGVLCSESPSCFSGTCIFPDEGVCSKNTPQVTCLAEEGIWDPLPMEEIALCQRGCCLDGPVPYSLITKKACDQMIPQYSDKTIFREDLNDEASCAAQAPSYKKGACVTDSLRCHMTTKNNCLNDNFNEGFLCTATHLETNCAKTGNTQIEEDGKVYFLDSCKNLANVYDSDMFKPSQVGWNSVMENYWTKIMDPVCGIGSTDCGNCNYINGTTGKKYVPGTYGMQKPTFGENTCASLNCRYEGEIKKHGESWCVPTPGANLVILADEEGFISTESRQKLLNNRFNLPGSRYSKANCVDGEITFEACSDYRNEFCLEGNIGEDFEVAKCIENKGRDCLEKTNEEECENKQFQCKWIFGYRFDGSVDTNNKGLDPTESRNSETQGSCVPLIPLGFQSKFTGEETEEEMASSSGENICRNVSLAELAIYETRWTQRRDKFSEQGVDDAAHRCIDNCYSIPEFGLEYTIKKMKEIYEGKQFDNRDDHISLRQFHYCEKGSILIGHLPVFGKDADCAKKENKRNDFPLFFKNEEWLKSIKTRAQAVGDCGYKPGIYTSLEEPNGIDKNLEEIKAGFAKLDQKGQPKDEIILEKIYEGNSYVLDSFRRG